MPFIREDQAAIHVSVDGVPYGDSWATAEGGNLEADDAKVRPGGMGREVSVGGPASRDDLTVGIPFSDVVATWHNRLQSRVGVGQVVVTITPLSPERSPLPGNNGIRGVLKGANWPDHDSTSSDGGIYEIVVSCHEEIA